MLCTTGLAAVVRAPVSFQKKETGVMMSHRTRSQRIERHPLSSGGIHCPMVFGTKRNYLVMISISGFGDVALE